VLRHQLNILSRKLHGRARLTNHDRWFLYPAVSLVSINPEDAYDRSARDAFALAQGRLSLLLALEIASRGGRPQMETELRALIRRMSIENPLWGAPRIDGDPHFRC
jgi:hypothetical protein